MAAMHDGEKKIVSIKENADLVTIKDIAKKANVAPSTVSNVLNNTKYVTEDIRERVLSVVDELGYSPNLIARSLKTKQTNTIGVIVPDLTNAFFIEIVNAIEAYLYEKNYSILVCCTRENKQKEKKYLLSLVQKGIDGLLFLGTGLNPSHLLAKLPIPIVLIDRMIGNQFSSVSIDNELGGYLGTKHLLERGAKRISFLLGPLVLKTNMDRLQGYQRALAENGVIYDSTLIVQCEPVTYESGWEAVERLDVDGVEYDAVFAASDFLAVGALRYLLYKKIRVPEQVKLVGFDGIPITEIFTPAITTVNQPKREMGERAARILIKMIKKDPEGRVNEIYEPELIIRDTS